VSKVELEYLPTSDGYFYEVCLAKISDILESLRDKEVVVVARSGAERLVTSLPAMDFHTTVLDARKCTGKRELHAD